MSKPFSMLMHATTLFIVLPKGMIMRKKTKNYGLHLQRMPCNHIGKESSEDQNNPTCQISVDSVKDLYGKFNIRSTYSCLLLFASCHICYFMVVSSP